MPRGIRWGVSDDGPDPRLRVSNQRDHAVRVTGADVVASRGGVVIGRTTTDLPAHGDVSSGYGAIEWCPGVVPPEDFSTWLLVVAQSLVDVDASPWEPLPAGGSHRLMTISLDQG